MNAKPALVRPRYASNLDPLAALWVTRLCTRFTSVASQLNESMYSDDLRLLVGITPQEGRFPIIEFKPLLKIRASELEQRLPRRKTALARNVEMLGDLLELDTLQVQILTFVALSKQHVILADFVDGIRTLSIDTISKILSIALKARDADVRRAIRIDGPLRTTRITGIEPSETRRGLQLVMPAGLRAAMFGTAKNIQALMSSFLESSPRPNLKADAFQHLKQETEILTAYLANASSSGTQGVNILIYGSPGTGKTEYVRWLVSTHQQKRLYQVRAIDDEGNPISGLDRLAFFQLSQRFLQKSDAIMLFDEIEDVFPSSDSGFYSRSPVAGKMYINSVLENNPVPAIWISNEVAHIDKAYLRRFDVAISMGIPPIAVRRGILNKYLRGHTISEGTINYLSQQEQLSPAQIGKAAKVLKLLGEKPENREATLLLVIENSQQLLAQEKNDALVSLADSSYHLEFLNADVDLMSLVAQLKRAPGSAGAVCFYGAPGTGKTALAHYIAREMELPLLVRRASDILGPYVGETEQKIALMFRQARQDGALLLLDEADSFLSERGSAKNSWEVTAVNEMLTQMDRFEGLFICSTNLMQRLDGAAFRRFALKIKFDYLKPEQRWRLFLAQAKKFSHPHEPEYRAALNQLNNLTPGDFATIRRQAALLDVTLTADELIKRLVQECKGKSNNGNQQIGFIHAR